MASNKDRDKKNSSNSSNSGETSIHRPTKSVTFSDQNDSSIVTTSSQLVVAALSRSPPPQFPTNDLNNQSSAAGTKNKFPNLSDQLDNLHLDLPDGSSSSCSTELKGIDELPENVIGKIFSYLDLRDIRTVSFVWSEWARIVNNENNEIWRSQCLTKLSPDALHSPTLLTGLLTFKSKLRAFYHAWNPNDCSRNIFIKPNGFTIHRNPVAQSTDGVRGKVGFTTGRHAWEVIWEGPLGTVAVVGIATKSAEMRSQGYVPLLGQDDQSWGWNLVENTLLHNGDSQGNYPDNSPRYQVGERIRVILDCDESTLSYGKDNEFYGVAFRGLPSSGTEPLFPAISAVYGNTEVSMVYLGPPPPAS